VMNEVGNIPSNLDGNNGKVPRKSPAQKGKGGSKAAAAKSGVTTRRK
jgi:hypothetical protein